VDELSDREKKILQLMAQGLDNKEIAKTLYIAEQTVKNHVSIIYSKLGVRDRVQASRLVIEAGLDKEDKDGEDK
jgi:DNA-binding NarL/FixJ family response regulator